MTTGKSAGRYVALVCGPPGAGKSTYAQELATEHGLQVYDSDDAQWGGSEKRFRRALEKVGRSSTARAVVIRTGATQSSREKAGVLIRATDVKVIETPAAVCKERVVARGRRQPPMRTQIAAVDSWWQRFEPGGGFFDGAPSLTPPQSLFSLPCSVNQSRGRGKRGRGSTNSRGYGNTHQKLRKKLKPVVDAGQVRCWRCGQLIGPGEAWDLGHDDDDRRRYKGPEHASCNRATAGRRRRWQSRKW